MYEIDKNKRRTLCKVPVEIHCVKCYTNIVKGETPRRKKPPGSSGRQGGGEPMKYHMGVWYYQGKTYKSLHEALAANWAR